MVPASQIGTIAGRRYLRHTSRSSYICLRCRLLSSKLTRTPSPSNTHLLPSCRYASGFDTEKWRKRIWGSENPPGQKNPYGAPSAFDHARKERALEDREEEMERSAKTPATEGTYKPATTWEGLRSVGHAGWGDETFDAKHEFNGFMISERAQKQEDIVLAIHRALVEVYTLKEANLPLVMDCKAGDAYLEQDSDDYARELAETARFEMDAQGETRLVIESDDLREVIVKSITLGEYTGQNPGKTNEQGIEEQQEEEVLAEGEQQDPIIVAPADDSWRNVSLGDTDIKFAVLKRVMQLTGTRIHDPDIANITNPRSLLTHLVKKPKPKKLAESLFANGVAQLPNVQLIPRRLTPIDREKEIGRWKVIERELEARGLPVTGSDIGRRRGANPEA